MAGCQEHDTPYSVENGCRDCRHKQVVNGLIFDFLQSIHDSNSTCYWFMGFRDGMEHPPPCTAEEAADDYDTHDNDEWKRGFSDGQSALDWEYIETGEGRNESRRKF